MIAVIGIGMEAGDITVRGKQAMKEADEVYSRTTTRYKSIPLSEKCGDAESFEQLDERICEFLLSREKEGKKVAFISGRRRLFGYRGKKIGRACSGGNNTRRCGQSRKTDRERRFVRFGVRRRKNADRFAPSAGRIFR